MHSSWSASFMVRTHVCLWGVGKEVTVDTSLTQDSLYSACWAPAIIREIPDPFPSHHSSSIPGPGSWLYLNLHSPLFSQKPVGAEVAQVKISFRPEGWVSRLVVSILATQWNHLGGSKNPQGPDCTPDQLSQNLWGYDPAINKFKTCQMNLMCSHSGDHC